MANSGVPTKMVSVRLPTSLVYKLEKAGNRPGTTVSDVLTRAVAEYLGHTCGECGAVVEK
jgi:hypothetical protein